MSKRISCLAYSVLAVILLCALQAQAQIAECSEAEINSIMNNEIIRNCALKFEDKLPNKGCTSLKDQSCYCQSPDFMTSMSKCLFEADPDLQDDLIRCGKWYNCPSFSVNVNITRTQLTPASQDLLSNAAKLAAITNEGPRRMMLNTEAYILLALLIMLGWMVLW